MVPVLFFGMLGVNNYALAGETDITDEQKEAIIEAHELRQSGRYEGARNVLEKSGLKDSPLLIRDDTPTTISDGVHNTDERKPHHVSPLIQREVRAQSGKS